MATQITNYRVFIASPGGLDQERQVFRRTLVSYSESEALPRGALFTPVGWEATLRGVGRAQAMINEEVKQCDFFVLLLWDRWGTPTGSSGRHSSGTEEEYDIAWSCFEDSRRPMREIIVFFKAVTSRQLSDPGEQLSKVLEFKKNLEQEKRLFFDTFDEINAFEDKLRRYLAQWLRLHGAGQTGKVMTPSLDAQASLPTLPQDFVMVNTKQAPLPPKGTKGKLIANAEKLAKQRKFTEAEALFTQAISRFDDPLAFRGYSEYLIRQGRWVQAEAVTIDLARLAVALNTPSWEAYAHVKLGAICMAQGKVAEAIEHIKRALAINESQGAQKHLASTFFSLGFAYGKAGAHKEEERAWLRCMGINVSLGRWLEAGTVAEQLAEAAKRRGSKAKALEYFNIAQQHFRKASAGKRVNVIMSRIDQITGRTPHAEEPKASPAEVDKPPVEGNEEVD